MSEQASPSPPTEEDYQLLGVTSTSTKAVVKQSYRDKAREYHPDKNPSPEATVLFQDLEQAYRRVEFHAPEHPPQDGEGGPAVSEEEAAAAQHFDDFFGHQNPLVVWFGPPDPKRARATPRPQLGVLKSGTKVVLKGLSNAPSWNDRRGIVQEYDSSKSRYVVSVDNEIPNVKRENLVQLVCNVEVEGEKGDIVDFDFDTGQYAVELGGTRKMVPPQEVILPTQTCIWRLDEGKSIGYIMDVKRDERQYVVLGNAKMVVGWGEVRV